MFRKCSHFYKYFPIYKGSNWFIKWLTSLIYKVKFELFLILAWSFRTHGHHQMLHFLPWDALLGLYCSVLHLLFVCGFLPSVMSSITERHALMSLDQVSNFVIEGYPISLPWEILELLFHMFWVIIYLHCEALSNRFCSIWQNLSREYSPEHFWSHPAAFISSHVIIRNCQQ